MNCARFFGSLLLGLLLIGCSSSQTTTTTTNVDGASPDTTRTADASGNPETPDEGETAEDAGTAGETETAAEPTEPDTTTDQLASPEKAPQDWYHLDRRTRRLPGLATERAYETFLADRPPQDTVVVAIIDSGIDVDHEDLEATTWTNADEVPGNDVDDDGNGYVDDVHGWNFIGGPDGENVNQDTYELTRLYVDLRARFADVDSADVASEERDAYERFQRLKREFQDERQQAKKEIKNVRQARDAVNFAEKVLTKYLGTDAITREAVDTISTSKQEVTRARDILQYFYRQDLTPEDIDEYYEYVERKVKYNYNPDFNPRSIVGDDYEDKTERIYGNNDVTGPDAEHGTHVGGIVGAERDNGIGIDGVARGVRLMPIRAVPNGDERDKDVANALRYAVDNGADVVNMSFGKGYSPHKEVVDAAVQYADSMGVLMVHAAGNSSDDVDSTENYPTRTYREGGAADLWIEVGASSWRGASELAAPFSNYGDETVDVFAPGHSIYSTTPGNTYDRNDGTSMAAPMVSGVAALLMAHYPSLSAAQVRDIILDTATPYRDAKVTRPGGDDTVRFGDLSRTGAIVNAYEAVERAHERAR